MGCRLILELKSLLPFGSPGGHTTQQTLKASQEPAQVNTVMPLHKYSRRYTQKYMKPTTTQAQGMQDKRHDIQTSRQGGVEVNVMAEVKEKTSLQ